MACADEIDSLLGPAPGTYRLFSDDGASMIPFEVFRGDIRMDGTVNGRPVRMLIDNGFLWDQLLFFGSPRVDSLGFVYEEQVNISGSADGEAVTSDFATGIIIGFPGVEFYDQTAIVTPYSSGISNMWWGTEGQVSATFLKHFVVDINFNDLVMTLIEPDRFVYEGNGAAVPLIPNGDGSWSIPATVVFTDGRSVSFNLALDLGLGEALHLVVGGDKIIDINGRPAIAYDVWELIPLFRKEGKSIMLTIQRSEEKLDMTITLRRVI